MTASLSNHGPSAHPADSFDERIRGLSHREGASLGQAEIFDPGHAPELVWRTPAPTPAGA